MSTSIDDLTKALIDAMPDEYEPTVDERLYYRDASTGDRGYLVKRDGLLYMRLDRPMEEILKAYREHGWVPEVEHRPLTAMQVAQVAHEADKRLCYFIGEHEAHRKAWLDMTDEQRIAWMRKGPAATSKNGVMRAGLYALTKRFLAKYAVK